MSTLAENALDSAISTSARKPSMRKNGQQRLKLLIESTDALLHEHDVGDVNLNRIAERAGVPIASVYHFFPSKDAALIELADVYFGMILDAGRQAISPPPQSWQELIAYRLRDVMQFYNDHPASMKLFFGTTINAEVRRRDMTGIVVIAEARAEILERYFIVPTIPDWIARLSNSVALNDGIWALAYSRDGRITAGALEEGIRATTAYLRCFLPEYLPPRSTGAGS
ncbi:TetR/AcrR family transcriptional regulator [Agrobacterium sp. T29]|uniref:TetR/AcrR family transcriptional regulator n=1 Tax=Agrobacterium sp. T29 TaxID=2580515 RepID=UPI00115E6EE3|nr:TetR/AcrR family transcriptional regulator [Agrobacterium sp. T29]